MSSKLTSSSGSWDEDTLSAGEPGEGAYEAISGRARGLLTKELSAAPEPLQDTLPAPDESIVVVVDRGSAGGAVDASTAPVTGAGDAEAAEAVRSCSTVVAAGRLAALEVALATGAWASADPAAVTEDAAVSSFADRELMVKQIVWL